MPLYFKAATTGAVQDVSMAGDLQRFFEKNYKNVNLIPGKLIFVRLNQGSICTYFDFNVCAGLLKLKKEEYILSNNLSQCTLISNSSSNPYEITVLDQGKFIRNRLIANHLFRRKFRIPT